ncbi:MAG: putative quinol monooxygenase [Flavobacteriales bacterium]
MIVRVVKMSFQPDKVEEFLADFDASKELIRAFDGCEHLELLQDREHPNVLFTYSYWRDPSALETYRSSELFQRTWDRTKALFNDKPVAWSLECRDSL